MRQIAGAFAEYEKARLVHKLRHARERKRQEGGKCEGRKSHRELRPEVVAECKRLRRASPTTGERRSLRKISEELASLGHFSSSLVGSRLGWETGKSRSTKKDLSQQSPLRSKTRSLPLARAVKVLSARHVATWPRSVSGVFRFETGCDYSVCTANGAAREGAIEGADTLVSGSWTNTKDRVGY